MPPIPFPPFAYEWRDESTSFRLFRLCLFFFRCLWFLRLNRSLFRLVFWLKTSSSPNYDCSIFDYQIIRIFKFKNFKALLGLCKQVTHLMKQCARELITYENITYSGAAHRSNIYYGVRLSGPHGYCQTMPVRTPLPPFRAHARRFQHVCVPSRSCQTHCGER